jgi:hypothetical protein
MNKHPLEGKIMAERYSDLLAKVDQLNAAGGDLYLSRRNGYYADWRKDAPQSQNKGVRHDFTPILQPVYQSGQNGPKLARQINS